jgi:hypothetical protein
VHLEAEILDSTCCHEFAEVAEEVEAWHGLVVQFWILEGIYRSEHGLVELLPEQRLAMSASCIAACDRQGCWHSSPCDASQTCKYRFKQRPDNFVGRFGELLRIQGQLHFLHAGE